MSRNIIQNMYPLTLDYFPESQHTIPPCATRLPYINCYRSALWYNHSYFYPLNRMAPLGLKNIFSGPSKEPQLHTARRLSNDGYMGPGTLPGGLPLDHGREPPTGHVRRRFTHKEITLNSERSGIIKL